MADSLAARRAVREHLETHFEEYLSSVSTYLRQAYPEFQLSNEVSEEIAATVIVRVSHANPEPTDIERALTESANEVVRTRRPRLSQAKLLEEVNGPLRSEFPRALPSLRLIQSLSRVPANVDAEMVDEGEAFGKQLILANPPLDLGASIRFGSAASELEPGFDGTDTGDDPDARVTHVQEPRSGLSAEETRRLEQDDDFGPISGTLQEVNEREESRIEARVTHAVEATDDDARPTVTRVLPSASLPAHVAKRDVDDGAALLGFTSAGGPTPKVTAARQDSSEPTFEEHGQRFEVPSLRQAQALGERPEAASRETAEPNASAKLSSVPPTQESIIPPRPTDDVEPSAANEEAASITPRRTRRKATTSRKKATNQPRTANKRPAKPATAQVRTTESRPTKTASPRTKERARGKALQERARHDRALPEKALSETAARYVADDLAVVAMMGFPSNPKRAAMLCVTAIAEELGIDANVDLTAMVSAVTSALDALRAAWTKGVPDAAHLEWQRVARQATMRAFLTSRP